MSGTGVLTTPSLRSVFQNYVPRTQNASSALISRTPPTSTSALAYGSYSPSNLGTGLRSSSIRRNSSTSDAGSGSAFGASVTSSSAAAAAAAKPQMIKRYSTNFSYRQNRERAGIYGGSLGSEASGSGSLGAAAEPSSYPRFGAAGGSLSSAYGRSWVSRMEQRQGLGTGGAFARTSSLDDATAAATASSASRYRPISAAGVTQTGGLTPSPRSHDEDMDDLVRLLETRPAFGTSSMGKLTSLRNERRNAPGLSSTPEEGATARPGSDALTDSVQSHLGQDRPSSLSGSGLRSGGGIRTANPMSRSQLDELLSRMAESVGLLGSKDQGSPASGDTLSDVAASHAAQPASASRAMTTQHQQPSQPLSHAQVAASIGKGRGGAGTDIAVPADTPSSRVSSPGALGRTYSGDVGVRSRSAVGQQVRAYGTAAIRTASTSAPVDRAAALSRDTTTPSSASASAAPQSSSTASLDPTRMPEYEAEGDLIFNVDGQQDYHPEDELPGEMEMATEENTPTTTRSSDATPATFVGGVEGGIGATLPVGAHREGRTHDWQRWERERSQEAERRRADAEMSRNFGQEVGASTRGRGASPWRTTTHSPTTTTSGATAVTGFRSSSTANRLVGVGVGATGLGDGRRGGYGVSAPNTQFHYRTERGQSGTRSYPVSRDEVYNDDDEEEED